MTEISHVAGKDNNITTAGGDANLCVDDFGSIAPDLPHADDSTPSPVAYSDEVVENLIFSAPSKICVDGYAASSFVTADMEVERSGSTFPMPFSNRSLREMSIMFNHSHLSERGE